MCITPNLVYINKNLRNKKNPKGIFFSRWNKAQEETFAANVRDIGGEYYKIPCRHCPECKITMSKEWALRAYCELQTNPTAYFITLTYENSPISLFLRDIQQFIKKARNDNPQKILKYIGCGEYGSKGRPHWHIILYGLNLKDLKVSQYNTEDGDHKLFESKTINKYWNHKGLAMIEHVDYYNCKYVAGYVEKKLDSRDYSKLKVKPPFHIYSKGIGEKYFLKNYKTIYLTDELILPDTKPTTPPRYFDRLLFKKDIKLYKKIKETRRKKGILLAENPISDYKYFTIYAENRKTNINARLEAKTRQKA